MQSLPFSGSYSILIRKIPYLIGFAVFFVLISTSLTLLVLPAKASFPESEKGLDEEISIDFPFPVKRKDIDIQISPHVDFTYQWTGILFNQRLEIKPKNLLQPKASYEVRLGNISNPLGTSNKSFSFSFKTESLPKVISSEPESTSGRIKPDPIFSFTLDKKVAYGSFELLSSPHFETTQETGSSNLTFRAKSLLKQNKKYLIALQFKAEGLAPSILFENEFLVVKPLKVVKTSPKQNVENASKNSEIKIKFNKDLKPFFLGSFIKITPFEDLKFDLVDKKTIKITPKPKLHTNTQYKITIDKQIEANDEAILEEDFVLKLKTAGPVKVVESSPTGFGTPLFTPISLTFDQPVNRKSAEEKFSLNPKINGRFVWSGSTMTFIPSNILDLFKRYEFTLSKGIKSPGGEPSKISFTGNFTTTLERQKQIGKSVKGRLITAYYFGFGSKKILLVGSMHGTESNTKTLLDSWVAYLRANQSQIPKDRTFIIVPNANPDGVAKTSRFNARSVDLNRNWDTPTWQKDSYWNAGIVKGGGGSKPFSEPETKALRDLMLKENPKLTLSYHSAGGIVVGGSLSEGLASWYASKTGYAKNIGAHEFFGYTITGTLEEWQTERSKVTIVVELASAFSSEYLRNLPALKGLLTY